MAIKQEAFGIKSEPKAFTYTRDQVILYALGVGSGVNELDFVYEKNLKVLPTFAVIPLMPSIFPFMEGAGVNLRGLLHGEQQILMHKEIPPSGTVHTTSLGKFVYDKGDKGALFAVEFETRDDNGDLLFENVLTGWDRTAGNFGGDPGPKPEKIVPPEGVSPDFIVEETTSVNQAALYRLSGDKNPLHIDPNFAEKAGVGKPILHGLCSYGFAGRAILSSLCEGDPARFKSFRARFTGMVLPGETLITEGWKTDPGKYIIRVKTGDGRVVMANATAEVSE